MFTKIDYVYAVYKEKSFTQAAKKLFISQPSLSAAIKTVEKSVGAPLFERTNNNITLTEVGREYISAAEKILRIRDDFTNRINDICNLEIGKISVGSTNYISTYILTEIINAFSNRFPKIEISLTEANSSSLLQMMENEAIDLIIDSFDDSLKDFQCYRLTNERILLCVPKDKAINERLIEYAINPEHILDCTANFSKVPSVSIKEFIDESFVMLKDGNDIALYANQAFTKASITPKVCFSVDQMNISYALANAGMGLCFVTDTMFKSSQYTNNVVLYNISECEPTRTLYMTHKINKYCTRTISEFIKMAKEIISHI